MRNRSLLALALGAGLLIATSVPVDASYAHQEIVAASASNATNAGIADSTTIVIQKSITLPWKARVVGHATLDVYESGTSANYESARGLCYLTIDGTTSSSSDAFNIRFTGVDVNVLATGARVEPAGTHTVRGICRHVSGPALSYNRGDLDVLAIRIRSGSVQAISAATRNSPDSVVSPSGTTEIQKSISLPWPALLMADGSFGFYTPGDPGHDEAKANCSLRVDSAGSGVDANIFVDINGVLNPELIALSIGSSPGGGVHVADVRCYSSSSDGPLKYSAGDLVLVAIRNGTSPTEVRAASLTTLDSQALSSAGTIVMKQSITLPWKGRIVAAATLRLIRTAPGMIWNASCQVQLELANEPIGQLHYVEILSNLSGQQETNVPLGGAAVRAAGTYNVQVMCFAPSNPSNNDGKVWFDRGVLNLIAVRV